MLKLAVMEKADWTYVGLAHDLGMSSSMVHASVKRACQSRLFNGDTRLPRRKALEEFVVHGVKYAFPPDLGGLTRGVPTALAAPVFKKEFLVSDDPANTHVWPHPSGNHRGMELEPLFKTVPQAAQKDDNLYNALAVLDVIRIGRTRERKRAQEMMEELLGHA